MFLNHWYMDTILHVSQYFLIYASPIYRYTNSLDTVISSIGIIVTWILYAQLFHVFTPLLYSLTGLHVLIIYVFMLHRSWFILLLHGYSCRPVTWLFPVTAIDIPVTGYMRCWYAMGGIPHLLFFVSRYPVLCYQQSSCPVIMLHIPCTVLVLATLCTLYILKITSGWGILDGWLDLIGWMYWIHIYPTAGDGSAAYQLYIAPWAPVSCFVFPS